MTEKTPAPAASPARSRSKAAPAAASSPGFTPGRIALATIIVLAIVGTAWLAVSLTRFFMLVFAAVVLGAIFDAIASWLCRKTKVGRGIALALSVAGIVAIFAGAFMLFGSQLAREVDTIREQIPQALRGVEAFLDRYGLGQRVRELAEVGGEALLPTVGIDHRHLRAGERLAEPVDDEAVRSGGGRNDLEVERRAGFGTARAGIIDDALPFAALGFPWREDVVVGQADVAGAGHRRLDMVRAADQCGRLRGVVGDQTRGCQLGKFGVAGRGDRIGGFAQIDARRAGRIAFDPDLVGRCGQGKEAEGHQCGESLFHMDVPLFTECVGPAMSAVRSLREKPVWPSGLSIANDYY